MDLGSLTNRLWQRLHSYAQWDEKAQFQNLMSVIKAKDTRLLTPALKQWINALTSGKAQLSQFEGISASVNELYALRFSANKADANTQSKQVMKALDKLSHEAKLARSEWKQKSEGDNNTLSALSCFIKRISFANTLEFVMSALAKSLWQGLRSKMIAFEKQSTLWALLSSLRLINLKL